jgi:alpha-tubulin suppressor-like RCC1 family protein
VGGSPPPFDSLSLGETHACGLSAGGGVWCWGSNALGELGLGTSDGLQHEASPVPGAGPFVAIAAGGSHTCALDAVGVAWCWGSNAWGELGRGAADSSAHATPDSVVGGLRFRAIAAGGAYTCGLTTGGLAYCWGINGFAQLGIGQSDSLTHPVPAPVVGGAQFAALAAGYQHTCALAADGTASCWGKNQFAELGSPPGTPACYHATESCSATPIPVSGGMAFAIIRPGLNTTCGFGRDGIAYCWGANSVGQLGDMTFNDRTTPAPVAGQP